MGKTTLLALRDTGSNPVKPHMELVVVKALVVVKILDANIVKVVWWRNRYVDAYKGVG